MHVNTVVRQPPLHPGKKQEQRRARKLGVKSNTAPVLRPREEGKGPMGFPPLHLHPAEAAPKLLPVDPSVQLVQNSVYSPAPISGEYIENNQGSSTGEDRVGEADGPGPQSIKSQIPEAFLEMMQEEAEAWRIN
ncbi:uncharacterized protein LOC141674536 [Apium graveolens]|uniref:uncharacterized protein LOC141674533 n=1 Tax=Apium graveolens TaxID=4045 RepID=UPI003D7A18D7